LTAVDFDDQPSRGAIEINDVLAKRLLPVEREARYPSQTRALARCKKAR
jgi:hypothetical protein